MLVDNLIIRKSISILLITALILSGFFIAPNTAHALMVEKTVTKYHLDIGAQHIWGHGDSVETATWDHQKGGAIDVPTQTITLPQDVSNVKVYPYSSSKFKWATDAYTFNSNAYLNGETDFNDNYLKFVSNSIYNIQCSSSSNKVNFSYTATLASNEDFDIKDKLNKGKLDFILEVLGGEASVKATQPTVYDRLITGSKGQLADNVYGFMYFTPVIIQYDVKEMVEVGAIDADLDLPATAKAGDSYSVADASNVDEVLSIKDAVLEKRIDGGEWQTVTTWEGTGGTGQKGKNTGGSVTEKSDEVCDIAYRITITASDGQTDTAQKTISITDAREISGKADLILDEYTYEGHPADAFDESTFEVDGVDYSAKRAYEEKVASSTYKADGGSARKETATSAIVTFPKRGTYPVTLNILTATGGQLSDTENIEVRKTPYIIDSLGGFQKQNRKQVLSLNVATYPDKPITDYYIKIKDKITGQEITLTEANPQVNNTTIKTRAVVKSGDKYWTNFVVEFLTKTPKYKAEEPGYTQDFEYTVWVKDSKGDTDMANKVFAVAPDKPPFADITMQDTFLRAEGTNTAEITAEDSSSSDGDQLLRTWSVDLHNPLDDKASGNYINAKMINGYKNLAFGTDQKIGFNKEGVGKVSLKLHVKDIWNQATLPEYITPEDYLEGETTKTTTITNIAPIVSINPIFTDTANIIIMADYASKGAIESKVNTIKTEFLEKNIDANIQVVPVTPANNDGYKEIGRAEWSSSINCPACQATGLVMDSEYVYKVQSEGINTSGTYGQCIGNHTIYAMKPKKDNTDNLETVWSYTVDGSGNFRISIDFSEKYMFVNMNDKGQTIILNRSNGAYLTTIPVNLSAGILSSDGKRMYTVTKDSVMKYDFEAGTYSKELNKGGSLPRLQNGKIVFVGKTDIRTFCIYKFDMNNETVTSIQLPVLPASTSRYYKGSIEPIDMDIKGRVVFHQKISDSDDEREANIWLADPNKVSVSQTSVATRGWSITNVNAGFVRDEAGNGRYVYLCYGDETSSKNDNICIFVYEIDENGKLGTRHTIFDQNKAKCFNGISYAQYHSDEKAIYLMQASDFNNLGYTSWGRRAKVDVSTWQVNNSPYGWDVADEDGKAMIGRSAAYYRQEGWQTTGNRIKIFNKSVTPDQSAINSILKYAEFKNDEDNYLIDLKGDAEKLTETIKALSNAGVRFVEATEDMKDLVINVLTKKEESKTKLAIKGDIENTASMVKEFPLEEGRQYYYSYDEYTSGAAIDLFHVNTNRNRGENSGIVYGEIAGYEDFSDTTRSNFFKLACSNPATGYAGLVSEIPRKGNGTGLSFSFNMAKDGYVEYNFLYSRYYYTGEYTVTHNGEVIETMETTGSKKSGRDYYAHLGNVTALANPNLDGISEESRRLIFLKAGYHTISMSSSNATYLGVTKIKVVYLTDKDSKAEAKGTGNPDKNGKAIIKGTITTPKIAVCKNAEMTIPYEKDLIKEEYRSKSIYPSQSNVKISDYLTVLNDNSSCLLTTNADGTQISASSIFGNKSSYVDCSYIFKNPYTDKVLLLTFDFSKGGVRYDTIQTNGKIIATGKVLLPPNGYYSSNLSGGENYRHGGSSVSISNIKAVQIPLNNYLGFTADTFNVQKDKLYGNVRLKTGQGDFYELDLNNTENLVIKKYYEIGGNEEAFKSQIGFDAENLDGKEVMISNFKLFTKKDGKENILLECGLNSLEGLKDSLWKIMSSGNGYIEMKEYIEPKSEEEETTLIYKKGELVRYNIDYSDYENDPSKGKEGYSYWLYAHTPMNDGEHPQAAIIYDEDGNIKSVCGQAVTAGAVTIDEALNIAKNKGLKILAKPIDRFYVDGKYTVYHWEFDDTSRGTGNIREDGFKEGFPLYDKSSNTADLTFYVEGSATAPWITGISTSPAKVIENNYVSINIGIDDVEKDILSLTTEVYKDKKNIFTHRKKNICPIDAKGNSTTNPAIAVGYPVANTGALPDKAQAGTYEVVCTVRDQTGAGIGMYKFVVVSEGKITGEVYHAEQWDINRKKYNLANFESEYNCISQFNDYIALSMPRARGTNVFWSGEKFMLHAEVAGSPEKVTCSINGTNYKTSMKNSGKKTASGELIYTGCLWDQSMINKWGRKKPVELTFTFTAVYSGDTTKKHEVRVIVDNMDDYWKLHRVF